MDWPFSEPPDTAVITTRAVLERREPILLISHDGDDGGWQFLGHSTALQDGAVVGLGEMLAFDPSLREVSDLPAGWLASRSDAGAAWRRSPA